MSDNPFDQYDLDPLASAEELTERFRELASEAQGADADAIRAAWEALTLHVRRRVVSAVTTFVDDAPPAPGASPTVPPRETVALAIRPEAPLPRLLDARRGTPLETLDPTTSIAEDPLLDEGPP
jgi:hypothetical protein